MTSVIFPLLKILKVLSKDSPTSTVSKSIKEAILRQATTPELKEIAMKEGFRTMQDMGRELILTGDLNFREYDRVLSVEQ